MTEHAPDRLWSGIDIPKTIAGALAAVCAAVIGSFLGVAGTLVGAAVASIVGSVGTEVYARSLKKGTAKLETLAPSFIRAPAAVGTPEVAAATGADSPSHTVGDRDRRRIRWGRVAAVAGVLFVLAIGTLTVAELITGRSAASTVGNAPGGEGTTVGTVFGERDDRPATTPSRAPAEPTGTAPSGGHSPAATPGSAPAGPTSAPADNPPTDEPSTAPTTGPTAVPPTDPPTDGPPPAEPAEPQELVEDPPLDQKRSTPER